MKSMKAVVFAAAMMGMTTGVLRADMGMEHPMGGMPQDKTMAPDSSGSTDQPANTQPMNHKKKMMKKKIPCDPEINSGCAETKMKPSKGMGPGGNMGGSGGGQGGMGDGMGGSGGGQGGMGGMNHK